MKASNPTTPANPAPPATTPEQQLDAYRRRVEHELARRLPDPATPPAALHEAMRYAVLGGGKRMRPLLAYATAEALGLQPRQVDAAACCVEIIHAYSLIHDDLPAMDDDALRRGRPTCHVAFGEATAILAGDALQALAFEVITADRALPEAVRMAQARELASACGSAGMAGGQSIDLAAVGRRLTPAELEHMHMLKTGALIRAAIRLAALVRPDLPAADLETLTEFGRCVGLAFQVHDDVLDESAPTEALGKQSGADRARDKPTYPAAMGLDGARTHAARLAEAALDAIRDWDERAELLRHLARYAVERAN